MLSNMSRTFLINRMSKKNINISDINLFLDFLNYYELEDSFSLGHISSKLKIDNKIILEMIITLLEEKYIKTVYEFTCLNCSHIHAELISFNEINDYLICKNCKKEIISENDIFKSLKLYFKVIKDE